MIVNKSFRHYALGYHHCLVIDKLTEGCCCLFVSAQKSASSGESGGTLVQSFEREQRYFFSHTMRCAQKMFTPLIFTWKHEQSVSGPTHGGQVVVFTLDSKKIKINTSMCSLSIWSM